MAEKTSVNLNAQFRGKREERRSHGVQQSTGQCGKTVKVALSDCDVCEIVSADDDVRKGKRLTFGDQSLTCFETAGPNRAFDGNGEDLYGFWICEVGVMEF